jgi:acetyl-CoA C-acetyltransferase
MSNMEMFEGRMLPDLWCAEAATAALKPCIKIATGGTSGSSAVIAGFYQVASGLFNTVLVVGWEKHSEGHTQTGMSMTDPLWDRHVAG